VVVDGADKLRAGSPVRVQGAREGRPDGRAPADGRPSGDARAPAAG
jgi:hypothetical protein